MSVIRRFLTTAVALLAASVASAQRLPDLPAPADVATPPAEALRSPSGLVSRIVTPGTGTETLRETDFVTVHYTGWTSEGQLFDSSHAPPHSRQPAMTRFNANMLGMLSGTRPSCFAACRPNASKTSRLRR